jgi:NAD-dependent SIR2 family protein deacetylase
MKMSNKEYKSIGKVVYLDKEVFYCPKCDFRYDFAIIYDEFPNKPSCMKCNSDMEIKASHARWFGIPHPKRGGW